MNQPTFAIQELQDNVNSLSDAREFCDREAASNYGSSHVPSSLESLRSPLGSIGRDFLFPDRDTEYIWCVGKVFEGFTCSERISRNFEIVK